MPYPKPFRLTSGTCSWFPVHWLQIPFLFALMVFSTTTGACATAYRWNQAVQGRLSPEGQCSAWKWMGTMDKWLGLIGQMDSQAVDDGTTSQLPILIYSLMYPLLTFLPFLSHFPIPSFVLPGIASQINYLYPNLWVRVLFWRNQNLDRNQTILYKCAFT